MFLRHLFYGAWNACWLHTHIYRASFTSRHCECLNSSPLCHLNLTWRTYSHVSPNSFCISNLFPVHFTNRNAYFLSSTSIAQQFSARLYLFQPFLIYQNKTNTSYHTPLLIKHITPLSAPKHIRSCFVMTPCKHCTPVERKRNATPNFNSVISATKLDLDIHFVMIPPFTRQ